MLVMTNGQQEALMQVGYGCHMTVDGLLDESGNKVDGRSLAALCRRGLALRGMKVYGGMVRSYYLLTDEGEALFEQLR